MSGRARNGPPELPQELVAHICAFSPAERRVIVFPQVCHTWDAASRQAGIETLVVTTLAHVPPYPAGPQVRWDNDQDALILADYSPACDRAAFLSRLNPKRCQFDGGDLGHLSHSFQRLFAQRGSDAGVHIGGGASGRKLERYFKEWSTALAKAELGTLCLLGKSLRMDSLPMQRMLQPLSGSVHTLAVDLPSTSLAISLSAIATMRSLTQLELRLSCKHYPSSDTPVPPHLRIFPGPEDFLLGLCALGSLPSLNTLSITDRFTSGFEGDGEHELYSSGTGFPQGILTAVSTFAQLRVFHNSLVSLWDDTNAATFVLLLRRLPLLQEISGLYIAFSPWKIILEEGIVAQQLQRLEFVTSLCETTDCETLVEVCQKAFPRLEHLALEAEDVNAEAELLLTVFEELKHQPSLVSLWLVMRWPDDHSQWYKDPPWHARLRDELQRALGPKTHVWDTSRATFDQGASEEAKRARNCFHSRGRLLPWQDWPVFGWD